MDNSTLFDDKTFYQKFLNDLENCSQDVIIESPYITLERMKTFEAMFKRLLTKGVKIYILTRDPKEHNENLEVQSEAAINWCERVGIQVLLCRGNHHRKLAIIDKKLLWEGSLNILSQVYSREIMRRIDDKRLTLQMFEFLKLGKFIV